VPGKFNGELLLLGTDHSSFDYQEPVKGLVSEGLSKAGELKVAVFMEIARTKESIELFDRFDDDSISLLLGRKYIEKHYAEQFRLLYNNLNNLKSGNPNLQIIPVDINRNDNSPESNQVNLCMQVHEHFAKKAKAAETLEESIQNRVKCIALFHAMDPVREGVMADNIAGNIDSRYGSAYFIVGGAHSVMTQHPKLRKFGMKAAQVGADWIFKHIYPDIVGISAKAVGVDMRKVWSISNQMRESESRLSNETKEAIRKYDKGEEADIDEKGLLRLERHMKNLARIDAEKAKFIREMGEKPAKLNDEDRAKIARYLLLGMVPNNEVPKFEVSINGMDYGRLERVWNEARQNREVERKTDVPLRISSTAMPRLKSTSRS